MTLSAATLHKIPRYSGDEVAEWRTRVSHSHRASALISCEDLESIAADVRALGVSFNGTYAKKTREWHLRQRVIALAAGIQIMTAATVEAVVNDAAQSLIDTKFYYSRFVRWSTSDRVIAIIFISTNLLVDPCVPALETLKRIMDRKNMFFHSVPISAEHDERELVFDYAVREPRAWVDEGDLFFRQLGEYLSWLKFVTHDFGD